MAKEKLVDDPIEYINAISAVVERIPGAMVLDVREVDPKAERCDGQAYAFGKLHPCGNMAEPPGTMCMPACRPEGFAWVTSVHDRAAGA